jgi:thiamine transporter
MDYVLAFAVLGLGGSFFVKAIKNQPLAIGAGAAAASAMRFVCHFISGVTIWGDYADGWSGVWVYSLCYNGSYMLAECIVTIIGTAALACVLDFRTPSITRKKNKETANV